jgi:hypothetical protein
VVVKASVEMSEGGKGKRHHTLSPKKAKHTDPNSIKEEVLLN